MSSENKLLSVHVVDDELAVYLPMGQVAHVAESVNRCAGRQAMHIELLRQAMHPFEQPGY